jgi:hypothetical protein
MVEETLEQKLKRHEDALVACMAEITKLREENARLRSSENNAHSVLREVYNDPTASPAVRVKAAGLALSHESAPLKPVSQLELKAEEPVIPLADLVRRRRARVAALEGLPPGHPRYLEWVNRDAADFTDSAGNSSGNGSDDNNTAG